MTEDYKPRPTHWRWLAGCITGVFAGFFLLLCALMILKQLDVYNENGVYLLALACGSFGGAIMRHNQ